MSAVSGFRIPRPFRSANCQLESSKTTMESFVVSDKKVRGLTVMFPPKKTFFPAFRYTRISIVYSGNVKNYGKYEKDVLELAQRIRKFCRVDRRRNIQIEVMKVLSSRLEEVCRVRRETKTRVIADNPGSSVFTTSAKVHPKASDTPCLQDALQKLQTSLNCAHMQAATTMASQ